MLENSSPKRRRGLIQTKWVANNPGPNPVSRDYLFAAVAKNDSEMNVVTVVGAAGSGKSILVGQLHQKVAALGWKSCWLNLSKEDNDVIAFLTYFSAALIDIDSNLGERVYQMLGTRLARDPQQMFQALCEDVSTIDEPCAIFLDDFHCISDAAVIAGIDRLIETLPVNVKLVVTSRATPGLSLSRHRLKGALLEIDQSGLKFSEAEVREFFRDVHGLELQEAELQGLLSSTEGWIAGLQLAALALHRHPCDKSQLLEAFSGSEQSLSSYLMDSVLNSQSSEVQRFLLRTAQLGRMNGGLCQWVSEVEQSEKMLGFLQSQNLFVIALDFDGVWFRYHHLFAEFLVAEFKRREPQGYKEVSIAASQWFIKESLFTEAIHHLLAAERFHDALKLIAENAEAVAQYAGDHRTMLDWIRLLPVEYHNQHPAILLNHAWSLIFTHSSEEARCNVDKLRQELAQGGFESCAFSDVEIEQYKCLAEVIEAVSYASEGRSHDARMTSEQALTRWPVATPFQKGALYNALAYSCIALSDYDRGMQAAAQARAEGRLAQAEYVTVWAHWISAKLCSSKGALNSAELHLKNGWGCFKSKDSIRSHAGVLLSILQAEINLDRGDVVTARDRLAAIGEHIAFLASREPLLVLQKTRARLMVHDGKHQQAMFYLRECEEASLVAGNPRMAMLLAAEEMRLQHVTGSQLGAEDINRRWNLQLEQPLGLSAEAFEGSEQTKSLMLAHLYLVQGSPSRTLQEIDQLLQPAQSLQQRRLEIELRVLRTLCFHELGQADSGDVDLAEAMRLAIPDQLVAPFLDAGVVMHSIFKSMTARRSNTVINPALSAFEQRLLSLFASRYGGEVVEAMIAPNEPNPLILTHREQEILGLAAGGLSNNQMAEALHVSVSTIKWHLHNVYDKLEVKNRTAAVARARQLQFIT